MTSEDVDGGVGAGAGDGDIDGGVGAGVGDVDGDDDDNDDGDDEYGESGALGEVAAGGGAHCEAAGGEDDGALQEVSGGADMTGGR